MANNCYYRMKAVADNEDALKRFVEIMKYNDDEFFIYRCFNADAEGEIQKENELFSLIITGDVAWSCVKWFDGVEDFDCKAQNLDGTLRNNSHYITLDLLCNKLGIGLEVWSQESGCEFEEHYIVNRKGEIVINEEEVWSQDWWDEENNCEREEPIEIGGFDDWGSFCLANEIFYEN